MLKDLDSTTKLSIVAVVLAFIGFACYVFFFTVVDTGERGLRVKFGEVVGEPLTEGLYFQIPIAYAIKTLDVREQVIKGSTTCFTKDTQSTVLDYAITYYPEVAQIDFLYKQFGVNWAEKIIPQVVLGALKDTVGQWIADDIVSRREQVKEKAFQELTDALGARKVITTRLDITNIDFDDAYERAVEAKVVALQAAAESKNKTVKIEEEARQKIISAEAEAKSIQIRAKALESNPKLVEFEAVQKWDGKLPNYMMGNTTPFINIK